jgi:DNA-binding transcriptional MocR family regulator
MLFLAYDSFNKNKLQLAYKKQPIIINFKPTNSNNMLILNINKNTDTPLYKQISDSIIERITAGILKDGDALPPSRLLAEMLDVNRSTVYKAYTDLWALGYIDSRPGSYSIVRTRKELLIKPGEDDTCAIAWNDMLNDGSRRMLEGRNSPAHIDAESLPEEIIDFSKLDVDTRLIPVDEIRKYCAKLVVPGNHQLFGYEHPKGNPLLRECISDRLSMHGIKASPDEILITHGSNQGIDLILRTYLNACDTVAIEAPTYQILPYLLRYHKANVIEIPMLKTGIDIQALEKAAKANTIKFVYTIPNLHNPAGVSTSQEHREKLLEICEKYHILLIEDGYEEEMKYFGKVHLPIKSMDKHKQVFYIGSLSKVFSPGLRLGWVVAHPKSIDQLCAMKRVNDITSNTFVQMLVAELFKENYLDGYIKRNNRVSKRRMQAALKALDELIPADWIDFQAPLGGYLLWIKVNLPGNELIDLDKHLYNYKIAVSGGQKFFWSKPDANYIRLAISRLEEDEIRKGISRLKEGLGDLMK